jgi:hypothetical protein
MTTDHAHDLPLPDYDHLTLGTLTQRIRTLDAPALEQLVDYERDHGNRLPVVQAMQVRLDELASGAEPSGGSPLAPNPQAGAAPPEPRQIDQTTTAPTINPPSQGDPTNPAQPR